MAAFKSEDAAAQAEHWLMQLANNNKRYPVELCPGYDRAEVIDRAF